MKYTENSEKPVIEPVNETRHHAVASYENELQEPIVYVDVRDSLEVNESEAKSFAYAYRFKLGRPGAGIEPLYTQSGVFSSDKLPALLPVKGNEPITRYFYRVTPERP